MKFKKIHAFIFAAAALFTFSALNSQSVQAATKNSDIVVNKKAKTVTMTAEVNGTYFTEPTRHGIVYKGGSNGEKAILRGLADEKDFYHALVKIGAKPGNNLTADDMKAGAKDGKSTKGSKLDVTIKWKGQKAIPFQKIVKSTKKYTADFRFSGNLASAKKNNTGCTLCLDSCATGIVSDAAWPTGTTQNKVAEFRGNKKVLPKDGTKVKVTFALANKK
ncbi:YdjY domain-containing protein [Agrilactobacillus yilanensis]|uniref:YdjY domain-containing protein n=1 Tax=Agrilactobacillus yilanensis TaxID=2485997 RepID=A0ABW4J8F5_9LACO|nr:YdjY domain-containing protein [Agrilactobacillus yilanensis]